MFIDPNGTLKTLSLLPHRDRLGVKFFDFVNGRIIGRCCSVHLHLDQSFGEGFGVGNESPVDFAASLRVGEDGEEVALKRKAGEEGAEAVFVLFDAFLWDSITLIILIL